VKRGLKARALARHPLRAGRRLFDRNARERLVDRSAVDTAQVREELVCCVGAGQVLAGCCVEAAEVARVPAVPATEVARRTLEDDDAGAGTARGDRRAQRGIAAANHHYVVVRSVVHANFFVTSLEPNNNMAAVSSRTAEIGRVTKIEMSPSLMAIARRNCSSDNGPRTRPSTAGTSGTS